MNKIVGRKIRQLRIHNNLTLEELANGIMHYSLLSKIENGQVPIHEDYLQSLLERLNVPIDSLRPYLLEGLDDVEGSQLLDRFFQESFSLDYSNIQFYFDKLDYLSLSLELRLQYLSQKGVVALNLHDVILLEAIKEDLLIYSPEPELTNAYIYYCRFFSAYHTFYQNYKQAEEFFKVLLENKEHLDSLGQLKLYMNLYNFYYMQHDYYNALEVAKTTVETALIHGKEVYACDIMLQIATLIGNHLNNRTEALVKFEEALAKAREINEPSLIGKCLYNFGIYHQKNNEINTAIELWEESLVYKRKGVERLTILTSLWDLANIYLSNFESVDTNKLETYIDEGLTLSKEIHNDEFLYEFMLLNAEYMTLVGQYDKVFSILKECEQYYKKIDNKAKLDQTYDLMNRYYSHLKKYKKASEYSKKKDIHKALSWKQKY